MSNLLLSSKAFQTTAITDAFFKLTQPKGFGSKIFVVVNSIKEGRHHPKMIELRTKLNRLGFQKVVLFDVLHDNLNDLDQADVIILNGGYEFYLLHCLKTASADKKIQSLIKQGVPFYGISAGAIVLGPDLGLYQYLYPEDNLFNDRDLASLNGTNIRIYPHSDKHVIQIPDLADKISKWEHAHHQQVTQLNNDQGMIVHNDQTVRI